MTYDYMMYDVNFKWFLFLRCLTKNIIKQAFNEYLNVEIRLFNKTIHTTLPYHQLL